VLSVPCEFVDNWVGLVVFELIEVMMLSYFSCSAVKFIFMIDES
jgi:hypothetical protein